MKIIKLLPCILVALPLLTGCPSVGTSEAVISIVSITPPPGSAIEEGTEIEAVLDYEMSAYEYVDYQITILFETTTGGYVVTGDNPSLEITLTGGRVTHT
ncbi:MAG: hypothetical protein JXQ30_06670 [Spirochaetes bacterium]|nr:hypothetical protein [Spirochaetota bacterium]